MLCNMAKYLVMSLKSHVITGDVIGDDIELENYTSTYHREV